MAGLLEDYIVYNEGIGDESLFRAEKVTSLSVFLGGDVVIIQSIVN